MTRTPLVERSWRYRLTRIAEAPRDAVERLRGDPDALVDSGQPLKNKPGDRCTVVRLDTPSRPLVVKRFNLKSPPHTLTHVLLRTRASWCWRNARRLLEAGLATPRPLAYLERRLGPLRLESYLLTDFIEGVTLKEFVERHAEDAGALDGVAGKFADLWEGLIPLRAGHDDMKATNFIVGRDGRIWMLDLDGMRIGLPAALYRRARRRSLERFMRNWRDQPAAQAAFRARIGTA